MEMVKSRIYLDNNATTPVRKEVFDEMHPFLTEYYGNPSSIHWGGREAKQALELARERVAGLLNCDKNCIVFTGSGSEGDTFAIAGAAEVLRDKGNHIITSAIEHPAVLNTCSYLEKKGFEVTYLKVGATGVVSIDDFKKSVRKKTVLASIMLANNETGTVQPIKECAEIAKESGILFHTDAVQAVGKMPVDIEELGVDILTISGHKINAPKGVGAVYVRKDLELLPLIFGGHQERNRRGGTENVPYIAGLGKVCELIKKELAENIKNFSALQERLENGVLSEITDVRINGDRTRRLPNTLNVSFIGAPSDSLLFNLDLKGIAASSGAACNSGSLTPSRVLSEMGLSRESALSSVRFSIGYGNKAEEIDYTLSVLSEIVAKLRKNAKI